MNGGRILGSVLVFAFVGVGCGSFSLGGKHGSRVSSYPQRSYYSYMPPTGGVTVVASTNPVAPVVIVTTNLTQTTTPMFASTAAVSKANAPVVSGTIAITNLPVVLPVSTQAAAAGGVGAMVATNTPVASVAVATTNSPALAPGLVHAMPTGGVAVVTSTNTPEVPKASAVVPAALPTAPEKRSWLGSLMGSSAPASVSPTNSAPAPVVTNIVPVTKSNASAETLSVPSAASSANQMARRMHLRFSSKDAAQQFLLLAARRDTAREEVRVLDRLLREKDAEQKLFSRQMQELFSVRAEGTYQYDAQSMTVFEVVPRAASATNQTPERERRVHLKLKDQAAAQRFLQLAAAQQLTAEAYRSLQFMVREKQMELEQQENGLRARYSISRDRGYQYDAINLTLYEIIEAPAGAGVTGEILDTE